MDDIGHSLREVFPEERVHLRWIDRIAYANDASYFRLVPKAIVQPASISEVCSLFEIGKQLKSSLTFRAAGTSLSGQAVTDSILVDISKHWGNYSVEANGAIIRSQPGIIGGFLNNVLRGYHRRIGPDPASLDACMLGGILANNSSGMCCGVTENAYRTVDSLLLVLPNGFTLDTSAENAADQLRECAPNIHYGLLELKNRLISAGIDPRHPGETLAERVRRRYQTKNNNGYLLNAFLDFESPLDILTHLMIGSEGTLGFIAEARLKTLPEFLRKYTGQLYFKNIQDAARAIAPLRDSGARAAEIMDRASLRAVETVVGAPEILKGLPEGAAAILVEYQAVDGETLGEYKKRSTQALKGLSLLYDPEFTEDPARQAALWKPRKGIIASVGAMRPAGTTCVNEDVAFPFQYLAEAVMDLRHLFDSHGYPDGVIFGHAKDGNLHFLINQAFDTPDDLHRFDLFLRAMVEIVNGKYDGALKAEHGTGRNMSPFVKTEWGDEGYAIMRDIKSLFDPDGLLSPGVLINDNPKAHVTFLKTSHPVAEEVDRCIECGYCESKCPSRRLSLTPRQRIVVQREIARLKQLNDDPMVLELLQRDYVYDGLDTCAVDGLCSLACPVGINTGDLTKKLRAGRVQFKKTAKWISANFKAVERTLGWAVIAGHLSQKLVGVAGLRSISKAAGKLSGFDLPKWNDSIPYPSTALSYRSSTPADFIYFPSCVSRQLGRPGSETPSLLETFTLVAGRGGINLMIPADVEGQCCGMPFGSKGYAEAALATLERTLEKMWHWSNEGKMPIVVDTTSCFQTMRAGNPNLSPRHKQIMERITILDGLEFIHDSLLPRLNVATLEIEVVLHPNCSARKHGLDQKMLEIAKKCARNVQVPLNLGCCAFAGDRGLLLPELTASATQLEAAEVTSKEFDGYYSSNIPCEIGMKEATGRDYLNIIFLVERASRTPA